MSNTVEIEKVIEKKGMLFMEVINNQYEKLSAITMLINGNRINEDVPEKVIDELKELLDENMTINEDGIFIKRERKTFQILNKIGLNTVSVHPKETRNYSILN
jgi:hypothetical protein